MERGVYQYESRGRQLLRFDGVRYGNITPTDIDGIIDYKNRVWILFEAKLAGKSVPAGQRLALERLIQNAKRAGKHGLAMIIEHNVSDCTRDVFVTDCMVREVYTTENMDWRPPKWRIGAKDMADAYINYFVNCASVEKRK